MEIPDGCLQVIRGPRPPAVKWPRTRSRSQHTREFTSVPRRHRETPESDEGPQFGSCIGVVGLRGFRGEVGGRDSVETCHAASHLSLSGGPGHSSCHCPREGLQVGKGPHSDGDLEGAEVES